MKKIKLGQELIAGMKEILLYQEGKTKLRVSMVEKPATILIKATSRKAKAP